MDSTIPLKHEVRLRGNVESCGNSRCLVHRAMTFPTTLRRDPYLYWPARFVCMQWSSRCICGGRDTGPKASRAFVTIHPVACTCRMRMRSAELRRGRLGRLEAKSWVAEKGIVESHLVKSFFLSSATAETPRQKKKKKKERVSMQEPDERQKEEHQKQKGQ